MYEVSKLWAYINFQETMLQSKSAVLVILCVIQSSRATLIDHGYVQVVNGRDVIDSRQIDKSTFSLSQLNQIEWLVIESKYSIFCTPIMVYDFKNKKYSFPRHFPVKQMQSETLTKY